MHTHTHIYTCTHDKVLMDAQLDNNYHYHTAKSPPLRPAKVQSKGKSQIILAEV